MLLLQSQNVSITCCCWLAMTDRAAILLDIELCGIVLAVEKTTRHGPSHVKNKRKPPNAQAAPHVVDFLLKIDSDPYLLAGTMGRKR